MNILLTGKLDSVSAHMISASGANRIILAANHIPLDDLPNNVRFFNIEPTDELFQRVIRVGSFDAAVFFLARGEHSDKTEGGVTAFQSMLEHCEDSGVNQVILVSSGEVFSGLVDNAGVSESTAAVPKGAQGFQIKAAEDMCLQYSKTSRMKVTIVRLPYIYQREDASGGDGLLSRLFRAVAEGSGKFELPGSPDTRCDFLSDVEAARLIWLIIDEGISLKSLFVNAGTGKPVTLGETANLVNQHYPALSISYSGDSSDVPPPMRTQIAKSEYGWNVLHNLPDDFENIKDTIKAAPVHKFAKIVKFIRRTQSFFRGSRGFIVIEFAAATAILHILSAALKNISFMRWIDLRLIFVVIMSTLHGTIAGIAAGGIAGVMLFLSFGDIDWRMIMYNPENWIPFALYIIMGVALGSKADRQIDSNKYLEDRLTLAEQTNVYLVELYDEAVQVKDKYRDQILGYKDNFGRIYSIVKKLNSETAEYVFSSAVEVLEDVLENNSIAIYSISANGGYARMTVCSRPLHGEIIRSLRMHDYPQIMEKATQRDIWFNRNLLADFPAYCAPVYNDEDLIALVMIWRTDVDQMSLHFSNLFRILTGLIQESLIRAVKFNKLRESTSYFPDSRILLKDAFHEAYKANLALAESEKADFSLLTAARSGGDTAAQNIQLETCIRESDIAGAINDTLFGIILKNIPSGDLAVLLERFKSRGVTAKQISAAEMNDLLKGAA